MEIIYLCCRNILYKCVENWRIFCGAAAGAVYESVVGKGNKIGWYNFAHTLRLITRTNRSIYIRTQYRELHTIRYNTIQFNTIQYTIWIAYHSTENCKLIGLAQRARSGLQCLIGQLFRHCVPFKFSISDIRWRWL